MKIGFWELVVIVIVAFVFIGPDQLPVYAKKIGKMLRELKKYTGAASEEIQKNVVEPLNEIQAPLKEAVAPLTDIKKDIDSSVKDVTKSFTGIGKTSKEEAGVLLQLTEHLADLLCVDGQLIRADEHERHDHDDDKFPKTNFHIVCFLSCAEQRSGQHRFLLPRTAVFRPVPVAFCGSEALCAPVLTYLYRKVVNCILIYYEFFMNKCV